jgi:hypothetical protein
MAVYIVKEEKKLKIITVLPHQEEFFRIDYAGKILVQADSTLQALMAFQELPDSVKYPDQYGEESSQ